MATRTVTGSPTVRFVGPTLMATAKSASRFLKSAGRPCAGTGKPSADERSAVRFHMLDVADPMEGFSVARFKELGEREDAARVVPPVELPRVLAHEDQRLLVLPVAVVELTSEVIRQQFFNFFSPDF